MAKNGLTDADVVRLHDLLDRNEIAQVVNDYFHAMDARDFNLLETVFTRDVRYTVSMIGAPPVTIEGYDNVLAAIRNVSMFRTSHHGVRNLSIKIDGDQADVNIFAMDALHDQRVLENDITPANRLIQHGLRYIDRFERRAEGWRISSRELHCLWQTVTANPAYAAVLPPW